jgi:hypothetical protein
MKNAVFWNVKPCGSEERQFLQEPHGVTAQETAFFVVTAIKASHLT